MRKFIFIYKTSTLLPLAAILLEACFKPTDYKIDQETKDYCLFAEDSYWIYQDSATLEIDSVVIDNPICHELEMSKGDKSTQENYRTKISLYFQDNVCNFWVSLFAFERNKCRFTFGDDAIYHNGKIMEPFPSRRENNLMLFEEINNYSINMIIYSNVKIFKCSEYGIEKVFYWAKHIGLVRIEIHNSNNGNVTINNLIKYNVKPYNQ